MKSAPVIHIFKGRPVMICYLDIYLWTFGKIPRIQHMFPAVRITLALTGT